MGTTLQTLTPPPGATRKAKRVGRGPGSGRGKTSTRGVKGQKARTGHHGARLGFEGGQTPIQRRTPKKGFKNLFRVEYFPVNVGDLEKRCPAGPVDLEALKKLGLVPRSVKRVKILADGALTKKFALRVQAVSGPARKKIEAAGGSIEILGGSTAAAEAG